MKQERKFILSGEKIFVQPHSLQERKRVQRDIDDGIRIRGKRGKQNLPNAWDDKVISIICEKNWRKINQHINWKRIRRKQYK